MNWLQQINKKLGGRVIAMLSVALLLSLVAVIFTDTWISSLKSLDDRIIGIRDNIIALSKINANILEAESAQRGYILTQSDAYLQPFNKAVTDARTNLQAVKHLVTEDGAFFPLEKEKEWLLFVSSAVEAKISEMQLTSLLVKQGKLEGAHEVIHTNKGMVDSQKILEPLNQMLNVQDAALNKLRDQRYNTIGLARISVYGSSFVLLLLVILVIKQLLREMINRDQLRQQLNTELEKYEVQLEDRTKLLKALALDAQSDVERERQKLARELHDELGSILTATKMDVSWAIRKSKGVVPEVAEKLSKTMRYLDQGIQFKREVVQRLRPSMIETFGFWPAMKSLIDDVAARNQWEMDVILPEEAAQISEIVSLIIYRVIQETMNNATKYAKATKYTLHLIIDLGYLKLELEDNGVGMDVDRLEEGATHGLKGMRNRVMAIGGHFELISEPGKGVLTRVIIPIDTARDSTPDTARDIERDLARDATRDIARDKAQDKIRNG
jgi:signal transduction histidine kinase